MQTVWLLLALACMGVCFFFPVAQYHMSLPVTGQRVEAELNLITRDNPEMWDQLQNMAPEVTYSQKASGFHVWPLTVLIGLTMLVATLSIFLFRNRPGQMRVVALAFLLNVVYVFLLFFWAVDAYGEAIRMSGSEMQVAWHVGAYAPIVSLVLFILAHRGIKRDESRVRAADRLR